jgi:hypothetical protein
MLPEQLRCPTQTHGCFSCTVFEVQIAANLPSIPEKYKKNNQDGRHFRFPCWSLGTPQIHQISTFSAAPKTYENSSMVYSK